MAEALLGCHATTCRTWKQRYWSLIDEESGQSGYNCGISSQYYIFEEANDGSCEIFGGCYDIVICVS